MPATRSSPTCRWRGSASSLFSLVLTMLVGFAANCPERPETVQRDLRELGPTIVLAPPQGLGEHVDLAAGARRRRVAVEAQAVRIFSRRLPSGSSSCAADGKRPSPTMRLGLALGEFLVYAPVRDQLGFRRARLVYTGGAPLGPDTFRFFRSFGINLKQVWGSTELSASRHAAARRRGESRHGRPGLARRRGADRRRRRGADPIGRGIPGLLQAARRHARGA